MMWFLATVALAAAATLLPIALRVRLDRRAAPAARQSARSSRPLPRQLTHRDWQYDQHGRTW